MKSAFLYFVTSLIPYKKWKLKARQKLLVTDRAVIGEMSFYVEPHYFWSEFNKGSWESDTKAFYQKYTLPKKSIIDIGGWIGPTMLIGYAYNPKSILVVEADPSNYYALRKTCARNYLDDKVTIKNICISDVNDETVTFGCHINGDSSTKAMNKGNVLVNTTAIKDFLLTCDLNEVSIIKIDIEGAEQKICEGLDYISKFPNIAVLLSIHIPFWDNGEKTSRDLIKEFEKFDVYDSFEKQKLNDNLSQVMQKNHGFFTLILKTRY